MAKGCGGVCAGACCCCGALAAPDDDVPPELLCGGADGLALCGRACKMRAGRSTYESALCAQLPLCAFYSTAPSVLCPLQGACPALFPSILRLRSGTGLWPSLRTCWQACLGRPLFAQLPGLPVVPVSTEGCVQVINVLTRVARERTQEAGARGAPHPYTLHTAQPTLTRTYRRT